MKPKFWQTNEFKRLEREWYARLEKEKFPDAEQKTKGGKLVLKQWNLCREGHPSAIKLEAEIQYHEALWHFLHRETGFRDDVEKYVIQRRAEGTTIKDTCKELDKMGERCYRGTIRKIIQKYELKWAIIKKK